MFIVGKCIVKGNLPPSGNPSLLDIHCYENHAMCVLYQGLHTMHIQYVGFLCLHLPTRSAKVSLDQCADLSRRLLY